MIKDEIFLGEASIIEQLLFGGEKKAKQCEKILSAFNLQVNDFKESFQPVTGYYRSKE